MFSLKNVASFCLALSCVQLVAAERYRVNIAENGEISAQRVVTDTIPKSKGLTELAPAVVTSGSISPQRTKEKDLSSLERKNVEPVREEVSVQARSLNQDQTTNQDKTKKEPKVLGVFERAFKESEGQSPYDAAQFNTDNYIDGDVLLGDAPPTDDSAQPFFITSDAGGLDQVIFYSPTEQQRRQEQIASGFELSNATVYKRRNIDNASSLGLPDAADPIAVRILSSGADELKDYFESFSERCCERLPKAGVKVLTFDRSEHLNINKEHSVFPFSEGESRFKVVKLPRLNDDYLLEIRSYIRKYREEGVEQGVFFPQIITLDSKMRPLRVITEPVLHYSPETWSQYGYLKGVFKIDRTLNREEEFVLVNTTKESLTSISQYETNTGMFSITHMDTGQLGVKAIESGLIIK